MLNSEIWRQKIMALSSNERIIVEAIRRAGRIRIEFGDSGLVVPGKEFAHDVAIAVQKYFNESRNGTSNRNS